MHLNRMDQKQLAKISKALSDPGRLSIYEAISSKPEMYCGELMKKCPLTPGTISHHRKILTEANLIESRREGQFVYNRVLPETVREYSRALTRMAGKAKACRSRTFLHKS
jgi:ArsR family transcriptional regulator, arsenate/arsenite/antimonite-responsive transcriptional repressor